MHIMEWGQGIHSLHGNTSYHGIPRKVERARYGFRLADSSENQTTSSLLHHSYANKNNMNSFILSKFQHIVTVGFHKTTNHSSGLNYGS